MKLSDSTSEIYASFFNSCNLCSEYDFPKIQVYARKGSWILTNLLMVDGITLGKHVFVNPKLVSRGDDNRLRMSKTLLAHEIVHVLQYQKEGFFNFLLIYVTDFWKIFRKKKEWNIRTWFESYLEIPHEVEAREVAAEFTKWLKH